MGRYYSYSEAEGSSIFRLLTLAFANTKKNLPLKLEGLANYRSDICLNSQDAAIFCDLLNLAARLKNYYGQLPEGNFFAQHNVSNMHVDNMVLRHGAPHSLRIHSIYFQTNLADKEFKEYLSALEKIFSAMHTNLLTEINLAAEQGSNILLKLQHAEFGDEQERIINQTMLCTGIEYFILFHNIPHQDISGEGNEMLLLADSIKLKACIAHENEMLNPVKAKPEDEPEIRIMGFLASQPIKSIDVSLGTGN